MLTYVSHIGGLSEDISYILHDSLRIQSIPDSHLEWMLLLPFINLRLPLLCLHRLCPFEKMSQCERRI